MRDAYSSGGATTIAAYTAYVIIGVAVGTGLILALNFSVQTGILAGLVSVLGLGHIHAMISRRGLAKAIKSDIRVLKDGNRNLSRTLEKTREELTDVRGRLETETARTSDALVSEVRVLETLVKKMGAAFEDRMDQRTQDPVVRSHPAADAGLMAVREALEAGRVDLYLQPIVSLPQRRTLFYEGFSRLRDAHDKVIMPSEYLRVAEPAGLMTEIDNLMLFRCVQIVRRLQKQDRSVGVFCNISPLTLKDESFFPQFLQFMRDAQDMAGSVIFEMGQEAFENRGPIEARNMNKLAELGFSFSVDKVTKLNVDFADLNRSEVKYVKMPAELIINGLSDQGGVTRHNQLPDLHAADIPALFARYGVELIAEKIEQENQAVEAVELAIPYGQGHLFGAPKPVRDQVLAEAGSPGRIPTRHVA